METQLDLGQMYQLMLEYFSIKASGQTMSHAKQEITVVLYDSFVFKFGLDERYKSFGGGIFLDDHHSIVSFLGEKLSMNNDRNSILANFKIVDNYCRLRLPDKFLAEFDNKTGV